MPLIKICGITSTQAAIRIAQMDIDMLGFVFAASRRRVSPEQAKDIISALDKLSDRPAVIGVFVNEEPQTVNKIASQCGLDAVQLSGDESWDYCHRIDYPVIQVLHITPDMDTDQVIDRIEAGHQTGLSRPLICMLDARFDQQYGGGGRAFDWEIAKKAAAKYPVMVAGGLSPDNVSRLISAVKPLGVDASSSLETNGQKDLVKVVEFVSSARAVPLSSADERRKYMAKYLLKR